MDQSIVNAAGANDFVNRQYIEEFSGEKVHLYFAYAARPAKMLGHRPGVCYPAQGWEHISTKPECVVLTDGTVLECLIHSFVNEKPHLGGLIVLNYYVLEGRQTTKWTDFWGPKWRGPNVEKDPNYYVAQVQITSATGETFPEPVAEDAVRRFAKVVTPHVLDLLPLARDPG